jgi:hypothetical protein
MLSGWSYAHPLYAPCQADREDGEEAIMAGIGNDRCRPDFLLLLQLKDRVGQRNLVHCYASATDDQTVQPR